MLSHLQVFFVLVFAAVQGVNGGEVIRADHSETIRTSSGLLRMEWGAVSIVDSIRGISISADSANIWVSSDSAKVISRARLSGKVSLEENARSVYSKNLEYDPRNEIAVFTGKVRVIETGKDLVAGEVTYDRRMNQLKARRFVRLEYPTDGLVVVADELVYFADVDSGWATGNTRVSRYSNGSDSLVVTAHWVSFSGGGNRLHFGGDVAVSQALVSAQADTAVYNEAGGLLELKGGPKAGWVEETGKDTVEMSGERLSVQFSRHLAERIILVKNTQIRKVAQHDSVGETQSIRADSSIVALGERHPVSIESIGNVTGILESDEGTTTDLKGERVQLSFVEGILDSLVIQMGEVDHKSLDEKRGSRLSGNRILLKFQNGDIRDVLAQGEAKCEHTDGKAKNGRVRLTGDRVELSFETGELVRAHAEGGVRGSYEDQGGGQ
jgi:lipopolysaccharide export system protein LptA